MLDDLATFVLTVDQGTLSGAARALRVPKSTISRRLTRLEEDLGQQLVQRTSRLFRLTEAGEALYRRSAPALTDLDGALQATRDAATEPSGDLRITAPVDLGGAAPFAHALVAFQQTWPRIRLTVDLTDRVVDLITDGVDVACRLHTGPLEDRASLMARRLRLLAMGLYATRSYLDRRGRPGCPEDLMAHDIIRILRPASPTPWPLLQNLPALDARTRGPGLATTSMSFAAAAMAAGGGIGLLPILIAEALPVEVERVLPELEMPSPTLSLVWPASRQPSPRVRVFIDFMVARLAK